MSAAPSGLDAGPLRCHCRRRSSTVAKKTEVRRDQKPKKYSRWDPSKKSQDSFRKLPRGDTFLREDEALGTLESASSEEILLREDQAVGQVVTAQANIMRIIVERAGTDKTSDFHAVRKTGTVLLCYVRALLKKIKKRVLVGDRVVVSGIDWVSKRGMVESVLGRQSEILDPPVANVDHMVVLFSLDRPKLEPVALSRFLVEAESMDIPFTLVLNKADIVQEEEIERWKERLSGWGYQPIFCSVAEKKGLSGLAEVLKPRTSVIVGPSGVGKSSLINVLMMMLGAKSVTSVDERTNAEVEIGTSEDSLSHLAMDVSSVPNNVVDGLLAASEVSERSGKGRHTTRNVTLLELANGAGRLVDTPGFSQPSLGNLSSSTLAFCFPEITKRLAADESCECAFADCRHVGEPNCIVGSDWDRYSYYVGFLEEVRKREELQKKLLGTKQEGNVRYKTGSMGVQQAEPRLVSSKHRRESRKKATQSVAGDVWEESQDQQEIDELSLY